MTSTNASLRGPHLAASGSAAAPGERSRSRHVRRRRRWSRM